jgi:hypothetical protein
MPKSPLKSLENNDLGKIEDHGVDHVARAFGKDLVRKPRASSWSLISS